MTAFRGLHERLIHSIEDNGQVQDFKDPQRKLRNQLLVRLQETIQPWTTEIEEEGKTIRGIHLSIPCAAMNTQSKNQKETNTAALLVADCQPNSPVYSQQPLPSSLESLGLELLTHLSKLRRRPMKLVLLTGYQPQNTSPTAHYHITALIPKGVLSAEYIRLRETLRAAECKFTAAIWKPLYRLKDVHFLGTLSWRLCLGASSDDPLPPPTVEQELDLTSLMELIKPGENSKRVKVCLSCSYAEPDSKALFCRSVGYSALMVSDFKATPFTSEENFLSYVIEKQQDDDLFIEEKIWACLLLRYRALYNLFSTSGTEDTSEVLWRLVMHLRDQIINHPDCSEMFCKLRQYLRSAISLGKTTSTFQTFLVVSGPGGCGKSTLVNGLCDALLLPTDRLELPNTTSRVNRCKAAVWTCSFNYDESFTGEGQFSSHELKREPLLQVYGPLLKFAALENPLTMLYRSSCSKPKVAFNFLTGANGPTRLPREWEYLSCVGRSNESQSYQSFLLQATRRAKFLPVTPAWIKRFESTMSSFKVESFQPLLLSSILGGNREDEDEAAKLTFVLDAVCHGRVQLLSRNGDSVPAGLKSKSMRLDQLVQDLLFCLVLASALELD